jgi:hypothetical protein
MNECSICKVTKPEVEERLGRASCLKCAQDRYARSLSNYVTAMSEEAVETPYGWCTALCVYRGPVRWLCLHIHNSMDEAQACLVDTGARCGGKLLLR